MNAVDRMLTRLFETNAGTRNHERVRDMGPHALTARVSTALQDLDKCRTTRGDVSSTEEEWERAHDCAFRLAVVAGEMAISLSLAADYPSFVRSARGRRNEGRDDAAHGAVKDVELLAARSSRGRMSSALVRVAAAALLIIENLENLGPPPS